MSVQNSLESFEASCLISGAREEHKVSTKNLLRIPTISISYFQEKLAQYLAASKQFSSIRVKGVSIKELYSFIMTCGRNAKEFHLYLKEDIATLDLLEVLNLMPKLEQLVVYANGMKICESFFVTKLLLWTAQQHEIERNGLKLPKLVSLSSDDPSAFKFFEKFLPKNQIVELSVGKDLKSSKGVQAVRELCLSQKKSIKKLSVYETKLVHVLQFLTIEELDNYATMIEDDVQVHPQVKSLKLKSCNAKTFELICQLPNLQVLVFHQLLERLDFNLIPNLVKLKNSDFICETFLNFDLGGNLQWISKRFELLEELNLKGNKIALDEVLESFPNLKVLRVGTSLKLNSFAKFLPKLKELTVRYETERDIEIYELTIPSVHHNLKSLTIFGNLKNFWKWAPNLSELYHLFPNLEEFFLIIGQFNSVADCAFRFPDAKSFFKNFGKFEKLKSLDICHIPISRCERQFEEIAHELVMLAMKLESSELSFQDRIGLNGDWHNFSYNKLIEGIEEKYEVMGVVQPNAADVEERGPEEDEHGVLNVNFVLTIKITGPNEVTMHDAIMFLSSE